MWQLNSPSPLTLMLQEINVTCGPPTPPPVESSSAPLTTLSPASLNGCGQWCDLYAVSNQRQLPLAIFKPAFLATIESQGKHNYHWCCPTSLKQSHLLTSSQYVYDVWSLVFLSQVDCTYLVIWISRPLLNYLFYSQCMQAQEKKAWKHVVLF